MYIEIFGGKNARTSRLDSLHIRLNDRQYKWRDLVAGGHAGRREIDNGSGGTSIRGHFEVLYIIYTLHRTLCASTTERIALQSVRTRS
jgi:hypothetical protein